MKHYNRKSKENPEKVLQRAQIYRGIISRVARKLGVNPQYVSYVAKGREQPQKVAAALVEEILRLEKQYKLRANGESPTRA